MKKSLSIIAAVAAIIAFASCGSTPSNTTVAGTAPETDSNTETTVVQTVVETKLPTTEEFLMDNFEDGMYFYAVGSSWDSWGAHNLGIGCDLSTEWKSEGEYSMKCIHEQAKNSSSSMATWCCDSPLETDWTDYKIMAIDFYNAGAIPATVCLQLQCTDNWNWCQTETQTIEPGTITTLLFDFSGFGRENLSDVKRIMLSNMGSDETYMYFDNMRIYQ